MFDHHWTVESLQEVVLPVIDIFGPNRCMFGSNFPVDKLHTTYEKLWLAYDQITAGFSIDERNMMFKDNCKSFYNL